MKTILFLLDIVPERLEILPHLLLKWVSIHPDGAAYATVHLYRLLYYYWEN